jgi:hypothetical protein
MCAVSAAWPGGYKHRSSRAASILRSAGEKVARKALSTSLIARPNRSSAAQRPGHPDLRPALGIGFVMLVP